MINDCALCNPYKEQIIVVISLEAEDGMARSRPLTPSWGVPGIKEHHPLNVILAPVPGKPFSLVLIFINAHSQLNHCGLSHGTHLGRVTVGR